MKKLINLVLLLVVISITPITHAATVSYVADHADMNMRDLSSLQNGAKLFVNYCLSCHSASYARYNLVAEDLQIPEDILKQSMMFTTEKVGDLMITTMPAESAKTWFGVAPPDLTLVSRVRKPDWVYTYLRAFYQDESSPSGWNNSLFENVAMPHAMYELQGVQRLIGKVPADDHSDSAAHATDTTDGHNAEGSIAIVGDSMFELVHPGIMSPQEFDKAILDLTTFLTYLAEPAQLKRKSIGVFSLGFLIILMMLCYLLKKEYWRDIH